MKQCDCELCKFENPKPTVTAIIIKDGNLLVLKRNEEPYKGKWDFAGGYMQKNETPEEALKREIKEELGTDCTLNFLGYFPGTASYHSYQFPILNIAFYVTIIGDISLNNEENSELSWVPIKKLNTIAFDSNQKILNFLKQ